MHKRMLGIAGVVLLVALAGAPSVLARVGDRTVAQTYPAAIALCAKPHTGTLPAKLANQSSAVIAVCDNLINAFGPLEVTVDAAEAQFLGTASAQMSLVASACAKPIADRAACKSARQTAGTTMASARTTRAAAVATFRASVEANGSTFWHTILALRRG
jgi:hypothetical protein